MKKNVFVFFIALGLLACSTYKSLDLSSLSFGMTAQEVVRIAGNPQRVLSAKHTSDGYQEVLEYRTVYDEVYALEFWNNYLTGYEFLYDDITYIAPVRPPLHYPEYGRPIYITPNRPNRPGKPNKPEKPGRPNRPGESNRPDRPVPSNPGRPSRPQTLDRNEMTKPAKPADSRQSREKITPKESHSKSDNNRTNERSKINRSQDIKL